jgi:SpoVK/Ycf46/Vps4 family AAA+-type ATPase
MLTARSREPILEMGERPIVHADVRFPSPSERAALLERALLRHGAQAEAGIDFTQLARRFALDPARLSASARAAIELSREHSRPDVNNTDLTESCRRQLRHDLESVAVRVTASHRWEDLVIPVDVYYALQEMIAYVRHAERVYDDWGFGARHGLQRGISSLFAGPPGTGKTMCASVMARELDMELFQVDLSRVVSKWIGETEKNLSKVFDEGERSNAIILFDEADALFARRTEVKSSVDRYANLEVNYLLQRMEGFSGITILTTNFEDTLDSAFKRRLTFRVRFEKPDAEARAALWSKVFPSTCTLAPDVSPEILGARFEMTGANIRNAAVRAAFLAAAEERAVDLATVMQAAERECREMGLLVRSEVTPPEPPQPPYEEDPPPTTTMPVRPKLVPVTHPRR